VSNPSPLLVIVGPTASGKTDLAIELAQKYDGEIICADSRTVYKGLDIGTAKPSREQRNLVQHHLLDVVRPDQPFTVADFKKQALRAMDDISRRGKLPIMVGGSGLYIDVVLFDYSFSNDHERDPVNPRHANQASGHSRSKLRENTLIIGIDVDADVLKQRIRYRVERMDAEGLINEMHTVHKAYPGAKALDAPAYKAFKAYVAGSITRDEAKRRVVQNDYQLSRRQRAWFKRNKSIHWVSDPSNIDDLVTTFLNKKQ